MSTITKEWLLKTIAELEEERDATPGSERRRGDGARCDEASAGIARSGACGVATVRRRRKNNVSFDSGNAYAAQLRE